jgi:periplasmic protein TonB
MSGYSGFSYWTDPFAQKASPGRQGLRFVVILAAHVGLLWAGLELASRPEVREIATDLMVRLVEAPPPEVKKELPQPKPQPKPARPIPPPPIMTAAPDVPAPTAAFAVPPQPPAPPIVEAVPAPEAPPVVTAARFDADYLSNPKPEYPSTSRRLGEEGKVTLRVHVSAEGGPLGVEIKHSCGFLRLDEAAKSAVERWRFVPAKRGTETVESWVAVPIVFSLQTS